ncbi:hypothetical protein D3C78_1059130 [compost metagenome]
MPLTRRILHESLAFPNKSDFVFQSGNKKVDLAEESKPKQQQWQQYCFEAPSKSVPLREASAKDIMNTNSCLAIEQRGFPSKARTAERQSVPAPLPKPAPGHASLAKYYSHRKAVLRSQSSRIQLFQQPCADFLSMHGEVPAYIPAIQPASPMLLSEEDKKTMTAWLAIEEWKGQERLPSQGRS